MDEILVDVHEPEVFMETLTRSKGINCKRVALRAGDYAFSNIGIERKQWKDFVNSLNSHRIWKQMLKMKMGYERPILAIEGLSDPSYQLKESNMETRLPAVIARFIIHGISVVILPNKESFIKFVAYLFLASDKKTPSLKPIPKKHHNKFEIKEDILCMIPGVGRKTAKSILSRYPTLKEIMHLSTQELRKIEGIGPKTANVIWEVLNS